MTDDEASAVVQVLFTIFANMETNYNAFRHTREIDRARDLLKELQVKYPPPRE